MIESRSSLLVRAPRAICRRTQSWSVRRALDRAGLHSAGNIHTFTHREELEALFYLTNRLGQCHVLEIGAYLGAATCYLAAGLRHANSRIWCVDTWNNETMPDGVRDTHAEFLANTASVRERIVMLRKRSDQLSKAEFGSTTFDLAFIDGDHAYEAVKSDFAFVESVMSTDATIAFHDTRDFEGPSRVLGDALSSGRWMLGGNVRNLTWVVRARFSHNG